MKRLRQEPVKFRDHNNTTSQQGSEKEKEKSAKGTYAPSAEWVPPSVALSSRDVAQNLLVLEGQMTVVGIDRGGGGYRMVRATHGVHNGAYFWEAQILPSEPIDDQAHVRLGWSTRMGELQAPVGYDKHSYAYRDEKGSKVHNSHRIDNYGEPFGPGDIIGCYVSLDIDDSNKNEMRFFKNGKDQGTAFKGKEIPPGVYFPAVSIFKTARVRVNFGPSFILRHDIFGANAVSEVQPMSPEDRKVHEQRILEVRMALNSSL